MWFLNSFYFKITFLCLCLSIPSLALAKSFPALAILSQIKGNVKAGPINRISDGFNGKMLWNRFQVQTEEKSAASIFFADGSEIRLFNSSNLKIGLKKSPSSRWSRYRILLSSGSFWGYFSRGKTPVEIGGEGLRILLSNASIRFTKQKKGNNISVSSGFAKVFNMVSSVNLKSGQRLYQIQKKDFLPQKIGVIPNKLILQIEPDNPIFSRERSLNLNLNFQVVRNGTDFKINRSGPIYLRNNYYNLTIPDSIKLNSEGESKIVIKVKPPHSNDRTFMNSLIFQAIMDQNGYDDVQDGLSTIKFRTP
tara:strand:+ start:314 stop:1234 length:921 start_codon:yes stop_codon:yes gene_type:complete